jgi:DNA helicase-2/ATP-dependent DNA helicase PcrA
VEHKVFGRGIIIGINLVGGDSLLEIAFDEVGTKRMLLNSASRYMKKVENG